MLTVKRFATARSPGQIHSTIVMMPQNPGFSASSRHGGCMPAMAIMAVMAAIRMVQASVPDLNFKHEVELFYAASLGPQS